MKIRLDWQPQPAPVLTKMTPLFFLLVPRADRKLELNPSWSVPEVHTDLSPLHARFVGAVVTQVNIAMKNG